MAPIGVLDADQPCLSFYRRITLHAVGGPSKRKYGMRFSELTGDGSV